MTCAKILCTGLVAGLIAAAEAAATPAWRDSVGLPASIGGSVQAQLRQGWLHAWRVDADGQEVWHTILGRADQPGRIEKTNPLPWSSTTQTASRIFGTILTGIVCQGTAKHWWTSLSPA